MVPPRIHSFEFCDQSWLSGVWREAYLDGLNFLFRLGGIYHRMYRPFSRWARASGGSQVLDLASGGAGPIETLVSSAQEARASIPRITLSDLFPDLRSYRRLQEAFPETVDCIPVPVNALSPTSIGGGFPLTSICTGFHHFKPDQAQQLLENIVNRSNGIFIMEPTERSWLSPLLPVLTFIPLMLAPFFSRRFSLKAFAISTLIPIVPLLVVFDGIVSALRMYRPEEILAMVPEPARSSWKWEWGKYRCLLVFRATYLFGARTQQVSSKGTVSPGDEGTTSRTCTA